MSYLEIIYGILFQPVNTLRSLAEEKPLALGLITFFLVSAVGLLFKQALYTVVLTPKILALIGKLGWLYGGLALLLSVLMLFIMSGFSSLLSELIYHKGNAPALLCCLSFCSLPGVLGPPLYLAAAWAGFKWLGWLLSFLVGCWVLVLQVLSLREALELDTGEAVVIYILPIMVLMALAGLTIFGLIFTFPMPALN